MKQQLFLAWLDSLLVFSSHFLRYLDCLLLLEVVDNTTLMLISFTLTVRQILGLTVKSLNSNCWVLNLLDHFPDVDQKQVFGLVNGFIA